MCDILKINLYKFCKIQDFILSTFILLFFPAILFLICLFSCFVFVYLYYFLFCLCLCAGFVINTCAVKPAL